MTNDTHLGVKEAAARIGVNPRRITALFYEGRARTDLCPQIGNRRVIPVSYLGELSRILGRRTVTAGAANH